MQHTLLLLQRLNLLQRTEGGMGVGGRGGWGLLGGRGPSQATWFVSMPWGSPVTNGRIARRESLRSWSQPHQGVIIREPLYAHARHLTHDQTNKQAAVITTYMQESSKQ